MKLNEVQNTVLYHGDNFGTVSLNPKLMMHGDSNNQEGIGIYFSPDKSVAEGYGSKISKIELTPDQMKRIRNARDIAEDIISQESGLKLLKQLNTHEEFWYLLTDYGIEVMEQDDVEEHHLLQLFNMMAREEIRNFQIELAEASDIQLFVNAWNTHIGIVGLYEEVSKFYSIIDTTIRVTPVNF